jgi:hypothetical protein
MYSNAVISFLSRRWAILLSLCIVTPLGFWMWLYRGPSRVWLNYYASGAVYEIFWCLTVFFFWPQRQKIPKIALGVFVITCLLEFLQLWKPVFLERIRATFLGSALIGTDFTWGQFPYYALGSVIGWLWLRMLCRKNAEPKGQPRQ